MLGRIILFLAVLAGLIEPAIASANDPVLLMYDERPPYVIVGLDGTVAGLTAGTAIAAFERAGVSYELAGIPTNRQILLIRENASPVCGIGWFSRAERREYARFTRALYRNQPTVVLMRRDNDKAIRHETLEGLIADSELSILVKTQFSYGPEVDAWLSEYGTATMAVTRDNVGMMLMVEAGRADYMLMGREEAYYLLYEPGRSAAENLMLVSLAGSPTGGARYLMCSRSVPQATIDRLNREIEYLLLP